MNGVVETAEGLQMWLGRRARNKPTAPGKLDHIVAGGQPIGLTPFQNLLKESAEEASLPAEIAGRAKPMGVISYRCRFTDGQRDDVLWCYDLTLSEETIPKPGDDEVEDFRLWPIERVIETLRETEDFKFNVALVIIDFLMRRGLIGPEEPGYEEIAMTLRSGDLA